MVPPALDLSENLCLAQHERWLEVQDARGVRLSNDAHFIYHEAPPDVAYSFCAVLVRIAAGRMAEDGTRDPITSLALRVEEPMPGRRQLAGEAHYANGDSEGWNVRIDTSAMLFEWVRQPQDPRAGLYFGIHLPRQCPSLELWQTGTGQQLSNDRQRMAAGAGETELTCEDETELVFGSIHPRNVFCFVLPGGGPLHVARAELERPALRGEPDWTRDEHGNMREPVWEVHWVAHPAGVVPFRAHCGQVAALNAYVGRHHEPPPDASLDFGRFYAQVYQAGVAFNLMPREDHGPWPRASVVRAADSPELPATHRQIAWACEMLYCAAPHLSAALLREQLEGCAEEAAAVAEAWPAVNLGDDNVAEILLMAGRHLMLTGDQAFARAHLPFLRRCAEYLLALRPDGQGLPLTRATYNAQGRLVGKEPYLTALCYAGLQRLAYIENELGDAHAYAQWADAARTLRYLANTPFQFGGLWHPERSLFINHVDHKGEAFASPRPQNWEEAQPQEKGVPRTEFALYQNVFAFWLGLVPEEDRIVRGYEWIDGAYSYASGRGGVSFPPHVGDNFTALLDVAVRLRYGARNADRLLQLILDHALDGGVPFTRSPYGLHDFTSPNAWLSRRTGPKQLPAGRWLDNAAFIGLVLQVHYGLDYGHRGWYLGDPRPIENYPLTRLTNLRHGHAHYALTWQGRHGRIKRVLCDGKPLDGRWLTQTEGRHEVVIQLA